MNPVLFNKQQMADDLTVYVKEFSDYGWKNRIVGLTNSGFLYVDERVPKKGYYEFHPKLLPWGDIVEVSIRRCVPIGGTLMGVLLIFVAVVVFHAGWIKNTHTGPGVVTIPLLCGFLGITLLFGALRNRIIVKSHTITVKWTSAPMTYRKTLSICQEAAEKARSYRVQLVESHV
jgi:hypothetical protein